MLPEPILLLGATGQLGRAFQKILGENVIALSSKDIDLNHPDKLSSSLSNYEPKLIINAAACTSVDAIEEQESSAHIVNADSVKVLAAIAKSKDIPFIHFSTDYVFSGAGEKPWQEADQTGPLNAYGRTKLAGEELIEEVGGKYIILRTSWVYSEGEKNFVDTMLRLGKEREVLSIVSDQIGSPSYAGDLADATKQVINSALSQERFPSGIYHICNSGETSWFEFAEKIFAQALENGIELEVQDVKPIQTKDYPTAAIRPLNSRLDTSKLTDIFGITLPSWEDAIERCIKRIAYGS